jgi:hypothetical protein
VVSSDGVDVCITSIPFITNMRLVLNLSQVNDHTAHGSMGSISSLSDLPGPVFATGSILGNICAPLQTEDEDDLIDAIWDMEDNIQEPLKP